MAEEDECKFRKEACKWSILVLFNILHQKPFIRWNVTWTLDTPTWVCSGWGLGGVKAGHSICLFCSPLYTTKVLHYWSRLENHLTPSTLHQGTDGGTVFWEGNSARPESVSKLKPGSSCLLSYPKAFYTIMERSIVFLFVFCCCFFVCVLFNFLFWHNFRFMKESLRKYREGYLVHSVG